MEVNTEERERPGQRPQVDYVMRAHAAGKLLYCVPVEAKKIMQPKDVSQLSVYQASLTTGERVVLGILVDMEVIRLSFSMFMGDTGMPLPITLVSPTMNWRDGPVV